MEKYSNMEDIIPLFGNRDGRYVSKALVEFRAGKMHMESGSNLVTPDKRKGLVQIEKEEDQLMHFKWKNRGSGVVEDDLIIFPDDIEFTRVTQCTTGRVFVLKFKSSPSRRMFFWMQEPKDDKDEDFCQKVNDLLNKPFSDGVGRSTGRRGVALDSPGGSGGSMDLSSLGDADLQTISDLQSILSGIQGAGIKTEAPVDLAYGITSEVLAPFLTNPEFVAKMKSHLPNVEEGDVANEISSTISSPQFQQALQIFSSGLQSGQLAPLIREFNLGDPAIAAAKAGDMKAFIEAIEKKMQKNVTEEGGDVDMTDV